MLIESERGYNDTLPAPGVTLSREIIFAERAFVPPRSASGSGSAAAAEFAGLEAPANHRRSAALVTLARRYLPGLDPTGGTPWMGHRPDDARFHAGDRPLAVSADVVYAFGHGHTGLTLGPTTGRLVADIVAGWPPPIDLTPFSISRFA